MKRSVLVLSFALVLAASSAGAQGNAQRSTSAAPVITKTADYVEQNVNGDEVVKFTGDELVGPVGGAYGDTIRRPPGVIRSLLIRPRLNFVPELLKAVENL